MSESQREVATLPSATPVELHHMGDQVICSVSFVFVKKLNKRKSHQTAPWMSTVLVVRGLLPNPGFEGGRAGQCY